jgi:hypothetical protein
MDIEIKVENYLKERFGPETRLISMQRLGEGVHGAAYLLKFNNPQGENRLIMKALFPSRFGHDHYSDRAQVLLLAQANYNEMPKHVRATDVVGESPDKLISVKDAREFYIFMEEAKGVSYFKDLDEILKRGHLDELDMERARMLAHFLADIHAARYSGQDAKILYRRRIRDLIGHGECIINIRLQGDDFVLLDRSRGSWGEPADDVSCLSVNYIHYAIKDRGTFAGPFAELFQVFLEAYLEKTNDAGFFEIAQPFFAFRVLVIANPKFYPDDTSDTKRKLIDFGLSVLETEKFDTQNISDYMERK